MEIVFASRNPSKLDQFKAFFRSASFKVYSLDDVGIEGEVEESGETLEENAMLKALHAFNKLKSQKRYWIISDDTGFYINALDGLPGIKATRWAGEDKTTEEITRYTLDQLRESHNRDAKFVAVVVIISPKAEEVIVTGEVTGKILRHPRVKPQPMMPYSPIFVPDGSKKVFAQMTPNEENKISHRGIAFRKARALLENFL